jgi:hypothetical protein
VYLRDSSEISSSALLLFGGEIKVFPRKGTIAIDNWIEFEAPAKVAVTFQDLRKKLDELLVEKIETPDIDVSSSSLIQTVIHLLSN